MVRCIPVTFVTLNDGEGGRKILGLSTAWTVYQRAAKMIEFGLIGTHKTSHLSCDIVLCWNDFSCPRWVSRVRLLACLFCHLRRKYSHPLLRNTKKLTGWLTCLCAEDVETLRSPIVPLPPLENQILIPNPLELLILERRLLIPRLL